VARRRRRGDGGLFYSKAEGAWLATISLGVVDGKRRVKKIRARSEAIAKAELEELRRTYGLGVTPVNLTLDEYLDDWLGSLRSIAASTLKSYREHVEVHISPLLGGIPVTKLRPADVDRLIADRQRAIGHHGKRLSPTTVRKIVTTLRIALNRGVKRGELSRNVAAMVDLPKAQSKPVKPMTDEEAEALVRAFDGHWASPVVRLLAGSGLRLGEALGLNQGDVVPGFVRLRVSKTTIRAVPISKDAQAAIAEAIRDAPRIGRDEPIFFGPRKNRSGVRDRLRGDTVTHAVPAVVTAAGLDRLTPHGFRHGAATLMVAKGAHMRVVAEQLGHKNPAMTARVYAHVVPSAQVEAVALLDRGTGA
jgi:integrase